MLNSRERPVLKNFVVYRFWRFIHNVVAHPAIEFLPKELGDELHNKTAKKMEIADIAMWGTIEEGKERDDSLMAFASGMAHQLQEYADKELLSRIHKKGTEIRARVDKVRGVAEA
jgi:hypothetical protein